MKKTIIFLFVCFAELFAMLYVGGVIGFTAAALIWVVFAIWTINNQKREKLNYIRTQGKSK